MSQSGLEGSLCTKKPMSIHPPSPLILIYLLAKLQSLQFRSVLKHAAYKEEVKKQREDADWGGKKFQLKTSPRDNLKGN